MRSSAEPARTTAKGQALSLPKSGANVVGMRAGMGGKTTYAAEMMDNRGHIPALDWQGRELHKLKQ